MTLVKYTLLILLFAYLGVAACMAIVILFLGGTFKAAIIAGFLMPFKLMGWF